MYLIGAPEPLEKEGRRVEGGAKLALEGRTALRVAGNHPERWGQGEIRGRGWARTMDGHRSGRSHPLLVEQVADKEKEQEGRMVGRKEPRSLRGQGWPFAGGIRIQGSARLSLRERRNARKERGRETQEDGLGLGRAVGSR